MTVLMGFGYRYDRAGRPGERRRSRPTSQRLASRSASLVPCAAGKGVVSGSVQLATGIVINGTIVVEGEPLPDGTVVTILAREADETFEVPPELEAELLESIAEADRGETIPADELLQRLRRIA